VIGLSSQVGRTLRMAGDVAAKKGNSSASSHTDCRVAHNLGAFVDLYGRNDDIDSVSDNLRVCSGRSKFAVSTGGQRPIIMVTYQIEFTVAILVVVGSVPLCVTISVLDDRVDVPGAASV